MKVLVILYVICAVASCFSYSNDSFSYKIPDVLAIFSGIVALHAVHCEHKNRNKDNNRMIYIAPLLLSISEIKEINTELDIIAKMTIHDGCEKLKKDIDTLQGKTTNLTYKISNELQETDKKFNLKNKISFEQYMEEHIYSSFTHLSQNSRQDETSQKVFQKDVEKLKNNITDLVNRLTEIANEISDKL